MTQFSVEYHKKAGRGEIYLAMQNVEKFIQQFVSILRCVLLVQAMSHIQSLSASNHIPCSVCPIHENHHKILTFNYSKSKTKTGFLNKNYRYW